jgi:hypothetical protein
MRRLDEIAAGSRSRGPRPWIAVKEGLAERAVRSYAARMRLDLGALDLA